MSGFLGTRDMKGKSVLCLADWAAPRETWHVSHLLRTGTLSLGVPRARQTSQLSPGKGILAQPPSPTTMSLSLTL